MDRDMPCALVARAFPFAVPNKKGTPTPIIYVSWHWFDMATAPWRAGVRNVP